MKLSKKLPLMIALPAFFVVLLMSLFQAKQSLDMTQNEKRAAYESAVNQTAQAVYDWLLAGQIDILSLADSHAVTAALTDFSAAWSAYPGDVADDLRRLYITENPNPLGQKDELVMAKDGSDWSAIHDRHHLGLRSYQRAHGYYDLFLFDLQGDLVYSVFKEDDFALNFRTGAYAASGLGEVFQNGADLKRGQFYMTDIAPYAPSADDPALFMSTPVYVADVRVGVVAIQLPLDQLTEIVRSSDLLGTTGEVLLIDNNGRVLTDSRHTGLFKSLDRLPDSEQILAALDDQSAYFSSAIGVDGVPVIAQTTSVTTPRGDHWGLVFEVDRKEAFAFLRATLTTTAIGTVITGLLLCLLVWFGMRGVIRRIEDLAAEMDRVAEEDYGTEISGQDKGDEIGFISRTLANLQVRLLEGAEAQRREKEVQKNNEKVVQLLSDSLTSLARGDFRGRILEHFPEEHKTLRYSINDAMDGLNHVIRSVRGTAESIGVSSREITESTDTLSSRTEHQAATLAQAAASLEEVTTSVKSASQNVNTIEETVDKTRDKAEASGAVVSETISAMSEIENSSGQIKQIISVIDDIAFQTNLLALNAGVEAARAGDAGRGFAVVASEVRGLAQRSSDAAREIKSLIDESGQQVERGVQMVGRTGDALAVILDEVREIAEMVKQVAVSSREQSNALAEINDGIADLDNATQENAAMAEENTAAAHLLQSDAERLLQDVSSFKTSEGASTPFEGAQARRHEQSDRVA